MVEIIPVIDIRDGQAVSGRSGDRENYKPLRSVFADSADPVEIAKGLPFSRLYVADLDGVMHGSPDMPLLRRLDKFKALLVDAGIRNTDDLRWFNGLKADMVLGSETLQGPVVLEKALKDHGDRVVLSIDIMDGKVLSHFFPTDPVECYYEALALGVRRVLFLDISAVGTCETSFPFIKDLNKLGEILLGGGISEEDLANPDWSLVDGVLIGTALHNGRLKRRVQDEYHYQGAGVQDQR